jgi:hypothetical protein
MRKAAWLLAAPFVSGCVSLEDHSRIAANAVRPGQRTIVVVYPSPGPWVIPDPDSKAESAAKTLPGLSQIVGAFQDERGQREAADLKQYLPRWNPAPALSEALLRDLGGVGYAGQFLPQAGSELTDEQARRFNRSADILTWQRTYFYDHPERGLSRNYAQILALDDALILEVNLLSGLQGNDEGNMIPTLWSSTRLLRANTLRPLWAKEDLVEDLASARSMYEFKTLPQQLVDRWNALLPQLSLKIAASLSSALVAPIPRGLPTGVIAPSAEPTDQPPPEPAASTGTLPSPAPPEAPASPQ